ncbi:hypothetical protein LIT25_16350 [Bacillus sp. F19]|nr:hypothetical protein LIT25_16350 [Bacillus sp. F19]
MIVSWFFSDFLKKSVNQAIVIKQIEDTNEAELMDFKQLGEYIGLTNEETSKIIPNSDETGVETSSIPYVIDIEGITVQ